LEREVFGLAGYGHFYFILVFQESYEWSIGYSWT
jgi:hypothetical protein